MNRFNIAGRYPDMLDKPPKLDKAEDYLNRTKKVFKWLKKQL